MSGQDALSILAQVFPDEPLEALERVLTASRGDIDRATNALLAHHDAQRPNKRSKLAGGLDSWLGKKATTNGASPSGWFKEGTTTRKGSGNRKKGGAPGAEKSVFELMGRAAALEGASGSAPVAPALPPLTLTRPEQVSKETGGHCTLVLDVLPKELAAQLFLRMLQESTGSGGGTGWEKNRWFLFDRQVESPHTTSFYVEAADGTASSYDQSGFAEAAHHWYNGEKRAARVFNDEMDQARQVIGPLVQSVLASRKRHPLEFDGDWRPNVAAANCYRGAKEGVGWHSDVLTYLGPRATIASLSLGVTRPFRLRPVVPAPPPGSTAPPPPRTLSIPLPHGSLIIMHAGCQEKFKHCVPQLNTLDVFRLPKSSTVGLESTFGPEALSQGYRERINMTFRFYRPDFAPLPTSPSAPRPSENYAGTPICRCGLPTLLRPDARGKAKARLGNGSRREIEEGPEDELLYFWTCNAGAQTKGTNCGWFELLDMEREGRGNAWEGPK